MKPRRRTAALALLCYLFSLFPAAAAPVRAQDRTAVDSLVQAEVRHLNELLALPGSDPEPTLGRRFDATVDIEVLTRRTFNNYVAKTLRSYDRILDKDARQQLIDRHHYQLIAAFRQRLLADLAVQVRAGTMRALRVDSLRLDGDKARVELRAETPNGVLEIRGELRRAGEAWKIEDVAVDGRHISRKYSDLCKDILDKKYSLPVLIAHLAHREYIVLDDFSTTPEGQLPIDWGSWRTRDKKKPKLYQVQMGENGKRYLAARDTGHSVILGKFIHWNPREYPIMTWCWKASVLPTGGDERYNHTNDSAAGIFVVFSQNWLGVPKQLKYVWSSTLPVGTVGRRNMLWRPWFFVVESGEENLGKWTFEMVDLYADHQFKLGGRPANRTVSLAILTDANSTRSYAEAYYADLRVWKREVLEKGRIENYCDCPENGTSKENPGEYPSPGRADSIEE